MEPPHVHIHSLTGPGAPVVLAVGGGLYRVLLRTPCHNETQSFDSGVLTVDAVKLARAGANLQHIDAKPNAGVTLAKAAER